MGLIEDAAKAYLYFWKAKSGGTLESEMKVRNRLSSLSVAEINYLTSTLDQIGYPGKTVLRKLLDLHIAYRNGDITSPDDAYRLMMRAVSDEATVGPLVLIQKLLLSRYLDLKARAQVFEGKTDSWRALESLSLQSVPTDVLGVMLDYLEERLEWMRPGDPELRPFIAEMEKRLIR